MIYRSFSQHCARVYSMPDPEKWSHLEVWHGKLVLHPSVNIYIRSSASIIALLCKTSNYLLKLFRINVHVIKFCPPSGNINRFLYNRHILFCRIFQYCTIIYIDILDVCVQQYQWRWLHDHVWSNTPSLENKTNMPTYTWECSRHYFGITVIHITSKPWTPLCISYTLIHF